ncbi:MAG: response regulator transcription factor [Bacteroidales bacterium]|nr:response regulator transcription factor [Bacteroidales bacterium]MCF8387934.1 response regulator transcription factor [Bacteroidales bacterium]MCF8397994.1 response regulator transcription factor [Bacteroidales bacterium]
MDKIKIVLADDHKLFRNGLKLLLNSYPNIDVIAEYADGKSLVEKIHHYQDSIVLIDIDMPFLNGIEASKKIIAEFPAMKIIALSMYGEEEYYYKMIDAGARGFLLKDSDINEVREAIETVKSGGSYFSPEILYKVVRNIKNMQPVQNDFNLSEREYEVLYHICKGFNNQEIADKLCISKRTVDKHRSNLLSKTDSKNTASLVMFAIKNKIVEI